MSSPAGRPARPGAPFEASTGPSSGIGAARAGSARYRARVRIHRDLAGWGVFFIVAGGVPLAVQTGLLDPAVLDRWWSFWPLILVGIGLGLIFTRTPLEILGGLLVSATFGLLAAGILTGGFGGIGEFPSGVCGPGGGGTPFPPRTGSFESDAAVRVEIDCGTVEVADDGRRHAGPSRASMTAASDRASRPTAQSLDVTSPDGDVGRFLGERDRWVVRLPTAHGLDLHLTVDAGEAVADLVDARLGVVEVELNAGPRHRQPAGRHRDRRDRRRGSTPARWASTCPPCRRPGRSRPTPAASGCALPRAWRSAWTPATASLSSQDFASAGLVEVDGAWETPGYDTAVTRIELQTEANAGSFSLNPPEGCS